MKKSHLNCNETQFQSVILKSEGCGPEICCADSKFTLKSRPLLHFFHKQPLLPADW